MGAFEHFPYTNFQDLNLNNLLTTMREWHEKLKEEVSIVEGYETRLKELETFQLQIENYIESGRLPESFIKTLLKWTKNNIPEIIKPAVQNVWFGVDSIGRLIINVPDSWSSLKFNTTGYDIEIGTNIANVNVTFGHLVVRGGF